MQIPLKVAKFRGEWIELYNPTDAIIDLSTYSVHSKDDTGISFTTEHTIQPKSTFLMAFVKVLLAMEDYKVQIFYTTMMYWRKLLPLDWIELRKGTDVTDGRFHGMKLRRDTVYSVPRAEAFAMPQKPMVMRDYGSPKTLSACLSIAPTTQH